jgi:hypothetical protein
MAAVAGTGAGGQRVTVRGCSHDGLGGNAATSARAVLDDK